MNTKQSISRTSVTLYVESPANVSFIEELLWTLGEVESVSLQMDEEEKLENIEVIGNSPKLCSSISDLFKQYDLENSVSIKSYSEISEEDWAESWKQYWHVNRVLPQLIIQPSWEYFTPLSDDIVLQLDPGSAFGTGTHETTQLMLFLLQETVDNNKNKPLTLLDVGTGSGILAIYAAKLGIKTIKAIDNDPQAVTVACQNIKINRVDQYVDCTSEPLGYIAHIKFDLVISNILSSVLRDMMPNLRKALSPNGTIILSGFTKHQYREMVESIRQEGMIVQRVLQKGNWLAFVCCNSKN